MIQNPRESQKKIWASCDSEAWFRAIFENAAIGIARVAPDGCWLEVNQRLCDIVGYTREEMMTKTFGDITHPDDVEADRNQARRLLAGEIENYSMEKRCYRKDGALRWLELAGNFELTRDGEPIRMIGVLADVTERKRMEEANLKRVALLGDVNAALAEHQAPLQSMMQKSAEALVRHLDAAFAHLDAESKGVFAGTAGQRRAVYAPEWQALPHTRRRIQDWPYRQRTPTASDQRRV